MIRTSAILRSTARGATLMLLALLMLGASAWCVLALRYWDHANPMLRNGLAITYAIGSLVLIAGFTLPRWRLRALAVAAMLFTLLLVCWSTIEPSNERIWQPENAVLAYASIDGDRITLHNIRNFDYHTETDFTVAYYDRTFELQQLDSVDLFAVYWMGPAIAHTFVSFGFTDGSHVAISIEARKELRQVYSSVQGFFRQYALYYAVADERDIVRVRTNYRRDPPEEVYVYRLRGSAASRQRLFLEYVQQLNALRSRAQWYNSLTTNCTNSIWLNTRLNPGHLPYSWKILVSGYVPEFLYEHGRLDSTLSFEELRRRAHINELAESADQAADFSQRIRATALARP